MYGWTLVLSLSVMFLLPAVYRCRYAMHIGIYASPSSGVGAGICSSFAYTKNQLIFRHPPNITFSSCYNRLAVGYFGLKLHRHILGTPKTNITSYKKGYSKCPLRPNNSLPNFMQIRSVRWMICEKATSPLQSYHTLFLTEAIEVFSHYTQTKCFKKLQTGISKT